MATQANPLLGSSAPGMPPVYGGSSSSTTNSPYMPQIPYGTVGQASGAANNPYNTFPAYSSPGIGGTSPTAPGASPITSGLPQQPATSTTNKTYGSLQQTIEAFLNSGAGYNPQVLQALVAQLGPQFNKQQQDLLGSFSAGGNRFGSGAQVGLADLMSQQNLTVGDMAAQLYESSVQNYMSVLEGEMAQTSSRIANTPSTFDDIMTAINAFAGAMKGNPGGGAPPPMP